MAANENMMVKNLLVITLAVFMIISVTVASEIGGINLPDTLMAGKEKLMLNGAGLRKKMFVKVYAGGLYLMKKSKDAQAVVNADEPMAIRMHFIYDEVSAEKLTAAWNEGFANGTNGNIDPIKNEINTFNSFFAKSAKKGDIYNCIYVPGQGVSVYMNEKPMGTIKGLEFKKALFSIWLGEKPADKGLKKGMMGEE